MLYNSILETIGQTPVIKLNNIIDESLKSKVAIYIKNETFNPGGSHKTRIAFNMIKDAEKHRYKLMRYHSAAHFVFHAIDKIYGSQEKLYVKGCYIYEKSVRFDYANKLNPELIPEVSALANDLIAQGGDIVMESDPSTKEISYWRYGDEIIIPCGGTHVRSAEEIGAISMKRKSHGKKLDRVYVFLE